MDLYVLLFVLVSLENIFLACGHGTPLSWMIKVTDESRNQNIFKKKGGDVLYLVYSLKVGDILFYRLRHTNVLY